MNILIIGGTGFISSKITELLLRKNYKVSILIRGYTKSNLLSDDRIKVFKGERNELNLLNEIISQTKFDAVYDMIAYEPIDSKLAYNVFKGKIGRFIHCSTVSVYMISNEIRCPITEDQDKGSIMPYFPRNPFGMEYGINKRKCEEFLWSVHNEKIFPVTTIRPPYVCGPRDPYKRDYFWIQRIMDGKPLLVPGSGDFATQLVFVDDLADTFVKLLEYPETIGNAYNVASEEIFSLNEYLQRLANLLNKKIEIVHVEQEIFDKLPFSLSHEGDVFPFNTRRTAIYSLQKIKKDVNYKSTPFETWMPITINWYLNEFNGDSVGYKNRRAEIEFINRYKEIKNKLFQGLL
ncbi:NAD-dependent epimerase/dehydratase family protein [Ignavibacteria bacterium 4148-Me]|uniref:NAD-dependent epimerase/dehydratase family protein n=1 Tax=Rosettibacter primus TaxID=3111523 RepID=UPI00336BF1E3